MIDQLQSFVIIEGWFKNNFIEITASDFNLHIYYKSLQLY